MYSVSLSFFKAAVVQLFSSRLKSSTTFQGAWDLYFSSPLDVRYNTCTVYYYFNKTGYFQYNTLCMVLLNVF